MSLKNYTKRAILLPLFIIPVFLFSQEFKVVGYLPHYYFSVADQIDYSKLTHLNLAFANPNRNGDLDMTGRQIQPIVREAHRKNVKVCLSLGGGALLDEWWSAWQYLIKPRNRSRFISKLIQFTQKNNLQGIDVDLEWGNVNENYSGFVLELRDSADLYDLILTAALPAIHRYPNISDEALAVYDWINIMAYDLTGPWTPNQSKHHSSFSFSERAVQFWKTQGVEPRRLTLGLPFYGWNFNKKENIHSVTFGELVAQKTSYAFSDQIGAIYFNGIPTIKAKTEFAKNEVGGVMLWQLGQDAFNEYSLLKAVDEEVNKIVADYTPQKKKMTEFFTKQRLEIYPNPFRSSLHIQPENRAEAMVILTDSQGRKVLKKDFTGKGVISLNTDFLPAGFYSLIIINSREVVTKKLIKS